MPCDAGFRDCFAIEGMMIYGICDIFILFGALLAFILAFGRSVEREHTNKQFFSILLLVDIGLYQLISYFIYCRPDFVQNTSSLYIYLLEAAGFLLFFFHGPLHYAYCHSIVSAQSPVPRRLYLHFLAGFFYFMLYLTLVLFKAGEELWAGQRFVPGEGIIHLLSVTAATVSYVVYMVTCYRKTKPLITLFPQNNEIFKMMIRVYLLGLVIVPLWPVDIGFSLHLTEKVRVGTTVYLILLFLISQGHPERMVRLHHEKEKYLKSQLQGLDVNALIKQLESLMRDEKIYREKLTLGDLAERLGVRQHQLSEILNTYLSTTFPNYLNSFRITEAKTLLEKDLEMQIIEIALDTGFNSLSAFYREFKKQINLSPADYRRQFEK